MKSFRWFTPSTVVLVTVFLLSPLTHAQAPVERGKYLVEVIGSCGNCHTPKGPGGDIAEKHMAGGFKFDEPFGVAYSSNITPDKETGIGNWTDAEIIKAIREGKSKDGRTMGPPMPFYLYKDLSDNDVKAMVAYLRTLKPLKNKAPKSEYKIPLPPQYWPPVTGVPDPPKTDKVKYGAYLAGPVAHCADCHTPMGPMGQKEMSKLFAGGFEFHGPWGVSYSANLTPDKETGIGKFTDEQVINAFVNGKSLRANRPILPPHPWPYFAGKIDPEDVKAILAFLHTVKPIVNKVPAAKPPEKK